MSVTPQPPSTRAKRRASLDLMLLMAQQEIIMLSNRDRNAFIKTLGNPPLPTPALIDLMRQRP
jgi:uncharacterized protein (DUF1778 family)